MGKNAKRQKSKVANDLPPSPRSSWPFLARHDIASSAKTMGAGEYRQF
jgi:hypothetical protein